MYPGANPFKKCLRTLYSNATDPPGNASIAFLINVFADYGGIGFFISESVEAVYMFYFTLCFSLACHIWFDLAAFFDGWPYRLLIFIRPGVLQSEKMREAEALYAAKDCCVDRSITQKLRRLGESPAGFLKCTAIMVALLLWSVNAKVCNMCLERLHALFRKAAPGIPNVERFIGSGLLTQVQGSHLRAGGQDIRKITRSQLKEMDAPIRSNKGRSAKRKRANAGDSSCYGSSTKWRNKQTTMFKRRFGKMDRRTYLDLTKSLSGRHAEGDIEDIVGGEVEALEEDSALTAHRKERNTYENLIGNQLLGTSAKECHFSPASLLEAVERVAPSGSDQTPGFTDRCKNVRNKFLRQHYITGSTTIPTALKLSYEHLCGHMHPYVCKCDMIGDKAEVHSILDQVVGSWPLGTFFIAEAEYFDSESTLFSTKTWPKCKGISKPSGFVTAEVVMRGPFDNYTPVFGKSPETGWIFSMSQSLVLSVFAPVTSKVRLLRFLIRRYRRQSIPQNVADACMPLPPCMHQAVEVSRSTLHPLDRRSMSVSDLQYSWMSLRYSWISLDL